MNVIIFGPQASGKGTQAAKIAERFNLVHISTGDIFRENISKETELGKQVKEILDRGELVPDEITNKIVEDRLSKEDCINGFILDGFPRNRGQAEFLDTLPQKINSVVNLEVPKEEIIKRISSRRVCKDCKANYNTIFLKPKEEGVCDKCGGELVQREDDQAEAIEKRLSIYDEQTKPLLDFYEEKGVLINIDGNNPIDEVFENINQKLSA